MRGNDSFSAGYGKRKTRKLEQFVTAMLAHRTVEAAAAAAGISPATAYRWLADPAVQQRIGEALSEGMHSAMQRLQLNATRAADNLDELQRTAESEPVRLGASRAILELGLRWIETSDVIARLERLENFIKQPDWKGGETHDQQRDQTAFRGNRTNGRA
jgi:hypothetical protein